MMCVSYASMWWILHLVRLEIIQLTALGGMILRMPWSPSYCLAHCSYGRLTLYSVVI